LLRRLRRMRIQGNCPGADTLIAIQNNEKKYLFSLYLGTVSMLRVLFMRLS